ncbi:DNA-directed RNA polymerase subunit alpha [Patescibacteria group bacterium]|nr:DNA-directed RNA polymerase subunit alpha [Patescibacteria group bacterium]
MENILLPSKMTFADSESENVSVLTIEPLHHGYGVTVGNMLRRVLLSSLQGAAVTSVKIKGVQHEFSTLEGVKEDILEIVLNLKQLRMKVYSDEPVALHLDITGKEGVVTASDIEKNSDVEIVNGDLVLATMTDKSKVLSMEIVVGKGRGYVPTEQRAGEEVDIGVINIDAMYSPVVNVGIKVENTRVGEITNYDKLVVDIKTDGSISPQDAVADAIKIILNHFNWIEGQLNHSSLTEKITASQEDVLEEDEDVETEEQESEE